MITGQEIHEGYNRVIAADSQRNDFQVIITSWEALTPKEQALYNNIAAELNNKVEREQEAKKAIDEIVLREEVFFDLFQSLRYAIDHVPEFASQHEGLLADMENLYRTSPSPCEFVLSYRSVEEEEASK